MDACVQANRIQWNGDLLDWMIDSTWDLWPTTNRKRLQCSQEGMDAAGHDLLVQTNCLFIMILR
ncbi:hypothetical protein CCR95_23550 [Thiocystis minor]|nr:hypothetical protein [Thiocystis minor]